MPSGPIIPSEPLIALVIAGVLFAVGRGIIKRTVRDERDPWLSGALTACLALHLACAPLQIWVVDHIYGGVADFNRYDSQGSILANGFRHFDFRWRPPICRASSVTVRSASWPAWCSR